MSQSRVIYYLRVLGLSKYVAEILASGVEETVRLVRKRIAQPKLKVGASRLGGLPDLPPDFAWPEWKVPEPKGKKAAGEHGSVHSLHFLAQIRLKDIAGIVPEKGAPEDGWLYFFYDAETMPWGHEKGAETAFRVIHYNGAPKTLTRAKNIPLAPGHTKSPHEAKLVVESVLPRSLPKSAKGDIRAKVGYQIARKELAKAVAGAPSHRMLCEPDSIQGDEDLASPARKAKPSDKDKVLLLQLDSDPKLGWLWEDEGRLFFWITRRDLKARRFDRAWGELQSH